jgi:outer membrane protein TolC
MLLCKQIGLPLDTEIVLADEHADEIPLPRMEAEKSLDEIYEARPETRSLDLAARIYDQKVAMARADMLPKVALTGSYLLSNPNMYHGYKNEFGGMFSVGVMVNIPIFHGFEALQKTRKAKAEATLYRTQLADAKDLINLQVTQLRRQQEESAEKLSMARSGLESAEENLRTATLGFQSGVIDANTVLAAQTAWLKAHIECVDAAIELQMNHVNLVKAEGGYAAPAETDTK